MATIQTSEVFQHLRRAVLFPHGGALTDGQLLEDYISRRDDAALAALIGRHGPMVWGVCRRILHNYHDAEDAFQATFLVLVRKAATIIKRVSVGNWLYGVAYKTALKARGTMAKRRAREAQVTVMPEFAIEDQERWRDLEPLLDEELSRMPDKYRAVIVLCDLQGKTRSEAARQLRCPDGTVAGRLARARTMLAKRLTRRGVVLSGGMLAAVVSAKVASASVPTTVAYCTIKSAGLLIAGPAGVSSISASVAALTEAVIRSMRMNKAMSLAAVALMVGALSSTAGLVYTLQAAETSEPQLVKDKNEKPAETQPKETAQRDEDAIQGTWRMVRSESDGLTFDEGRPEIEGNGLVIDKTSVTLTTKLIHDPRIKKEPEDVKAIGALALDTKANPKQLVITWEPNAWQPKESRVLRGIYSLDGDTLRLCMYFEGADTKSPFPTEFSAGAGSKRAVNTWQRVPPVDRRNERKPARTDLSKIQPPGGVPLFPSKAPITVDSLEKVKKRLESAPAEVLDKWVGELERIMDKKLEGLSKLASRTEIADRMSVAFDDHKWNPPAADKLFKRARTLSPAEFKAWKEALEAVLKKEIGQTDDKVFDGGPDYAVPLVLIPVEAFHEGEKYSIERGKKYRARLKQLTADDVTLWKTKVDRFGGTELDAAVNIILLDEFFQGESFKRDAFKTAVEQQGKKEVPGSAAEEVEKLQGNWQLVSLGYDGLTIGEGRRELESTRLLIQQKSLRLFCTAESVLAEPTSKQADADFAFDATRHPKIMVLTWKECPWNGKKDFVRKAIYAIEGDKLKLCLSRNDNETEAPSDFSAKTGSQRLAWTFKCISSPPKDASKTDSRKGQVGPVQRDNPAKSPPAKSGTPPYLAEFRRLKDEMSKIEEAIEKEIAAAKSEKERDEAIGQAMRILKEKGEPLADKALASVKPHASEQEAVEVLIWLLNQQPASNAANAAAALLASHHLQDPQTLDAVCRFQHAPFSWTESLLQKLADADLPRERKVLAVVALAGLAKTRADLPGMLKEFDPAQRSIIEDRFGKQYMAELYAANPGQLEAEAVRRFEELSRKYGTEKYGEKTVKDYAEGALFEMRHLTVGKQAPDVEGEDLDGKRFKLSDYRGKVVLLDFWGNW